MTLDKLNDKHANDVGKKFDGGKLQWSLLPFDALIGVIERFGKGAEKYGRDNWMQVEDAKNRYFDALMRHLSAYKMGQELDDDPRFQDLKRGKYHLTAALWNLVALEYLDMREKNELTAQSNDTITKTSNSVAKEIFCNEREGFYNKEKRRIYIDD